MKIRYYSLTVLVILFVIVAAMYGVDLYRSINSPTEVTVTFRAANKVGESVEPVVYDAVIGSYLSSDTVPVLVYECQFKEIPDRAYSFKVFSDQLNEAEMASYLVDMFIRIDEANESIAADSLTLIFIFSDSYNDFLQHWGSSYWLPREMKKALIEGRSALLGLDSNESIIQSVFGLDDDSVRQKNKSDSAIHQALKKYYQRRVGKR